LSWLRAGRAEQWEVLARAWLESQRWNDLALVPTLLPDPVRGWPNDPLQTRRQVMELLRQCTPGVWYPLAGFIAHVHQHTPDFLRPHADYEAWNLRDALTETSLRGFEAWHAVEGALLATLLTQPLAWLGIVDLGRASPLLAPESFRVSALGAALLTSAEVPTLPPPAPVALEPGAIFAVPLGRRYEHFQLSRIAEWTGKSADAYRYRLTSTSLTRARQQRIPLRRITEFLTEATGRSLPAALRKAIERAYRQGGRAQLTQVWVLRVKDPDLLDYEEVQELLQERLGPRVALVRDADVERLTTVLIQAGLLPDVEACFSFSASAGDICERRESP